MGIYSQLVTSDKVPPSSRQDSRQQSRQLEEKPPLPPKDDDAILSRPKAFYITSSQSESLDALVKVMRTKASGKTTVKIDRSTVVRLLLDRAELENKELADELIDTLLIQLKEYFQ